MEENFSVLLSLYYKESPSALRQSLNSIFQQTILPTEVVLVKDGPLTPELEEVLEEYSRHSNLKIVPLKENQGLGKALNEGLKHCTYDIVARMDTDDIAKPERFEKQLKVFQEHPEYDVVGAWIEEFEGDIENIMSIRKLPEHPDEIYLFGKKRCPMNHPCVMYKKSAVLESGGYRKFPEDYYLWGYMLNNGCKFYNIQESLLWFRSSRAVFQRRGGWKYAMNELELQRDFLKIGYINLFQFIRNVTIRFTTRMVPNKVREFIYKKLLR